MDFATYQKCAAGTDRNPGKDPRDIMIPLLGLAGETGELLSEYKKFLRDGVSHTTFTDRFAEEMGDVLWYLADIATKFDLSLADVAASNLRKCENRWGTLPERTAFDADFPEDQKIPRRFVIDFATTHDENEQPVVRVYFQGEPYGDTLTDNSYEADGYSFHDAIHLSFAAVLGWSPLTRKLLGVKRKADEKVDEVEDGARAVYLEEGLSTMIFAYAKDHNWLEGKSSVSTELLRMIKNMTSHLEVSVCTEGEWERAIIQGFEVLRKIRAQRSGSLVVDLNSRTISFKK